MTGSEGAVNPLTMQDIIVLAAFFGILLGGLLFLTLIALSPRAPQPEPWNAEYQEAMQWCKARRWDQEANAMVSDTPPPEHLKEVIAHIERRETFMRKEAHRLNEHHKRSQL